MTPEDAAVEEPTAARSGYLATTEWSLPQFILVFATGIVAAVAATAAALVIWGQDLSVSVFAFVFGVQGGASFLAMVVLSRTRGTGSLARDFGLRLRLGDFWAVFAGMGLQIAVALMMAPLIQLLYPDGPPSQEVAELTSESSTVLDGVLIIVMVGLVAPLVEEMMFRGMLLARASRSMRIAWAVVVTSAVFAGVHLLDPNAIAALPGLFIICVVLAIVAVRRGDLSLAIPIHAGVNLTAALILVFGDQIADRLTDLQENLEQVEAVVRALL